MVANVSARSAKADPVVVAVPRRPGQVLLLKIPEAAGMLRIGLTKFYELMRDGEITPISVGPHATRIPVSEVERFIAERLTAARPAREAG
jgi:excisionase family DNA binding protein